MAQAASEPGCQELADENRALRKEVAALKDRVAELEQAIQETLAGLASLSLLEVSYDLGPPFTAETN